MKNSMSVVLVLNRGGRMINSVKLKNFGLIKDLEWNNLSNINVIVGTNGTGKTFLMKALYASLKTLETFQKGNEMRNESEILSDKLHWLFQTGKIGNLVTKGAQESLECAIENDTKLFSYKFGKDTTKKINHITNRNPLRDSNSIFIPAKEVLSLQKIILQSKEARVFGFDETYYDLSAALQIPKTRGKSSKEVSKSRKVLEELLNGKIENDVESGEWIFKKGKQKYSLGVTAEGIKKIAILDHLLGNRYLTKDSVIFIDEPEAGLHPDAIVKLMEILHLLSSYGMQIFIATHSYFVIKKLFLIAKSNSISIPFLSLNSDDEFLKSDLRDELPDNDIVSQSVKLYKQEIVGGAAVWE